MEKTQNKMKGIILAGGFGTRLRPLTLITNKHLLPVYDKPMIMYPLDTLKKSGIKEIMIVCGKEHAGHFMNFLGSGEDFGVKLSYALQKGSGGIAEALGLAKDFADGSKIAVILGDNIFERSFSKEIEKFKKMEGAMVFLKKVSDPKRFGVAQIKGNKIINIEEKPKKPKSNKVTTGFYLYNPDVFKKVKELKPSWRGELELTDIHNMYIKENKLGWSEVKGYWSDAGTLETLLSSSNWAAKNFSNK